MTINPENAPIAIFVYNRPNHVCTLFNSLQKNPEFSDSPVYIFCDGPKDNSSCSEKKAVSKARELVKSIAPPYSVIIERETNLGLADSIITGVTKLCNDYDRVIVMEDDLEVSPGTLKYLNTALKKYKNEEKVMHISAYMYPVENQDELPETFFYQEATCWGWATWTRAWKHFEQDSQKIIEAINKSNLKAKFDKDNTMHFYEMLKKQNKGEIDSWAIRWYGSIFKNKGLALHPAYSFVQNTGNDDSGNNCPSTLKFFHANLNKSENLTYPEQIIENKLAIKLMKKYRKKYFGSRSKLSSRFIKFYKRLIK